MHIFVSPYMNVNILQVLLLLESKDLTLTVQSQTVAKLLLLYFAALCVIYTV